MILKNLPMPPAVISNSFIVSSSNWWSSLGVSSLHKHTQDTWEQNTAQKTFWHYFALQQFATSICTDQILIVLNRNCFLLLVLSLNHLLFNINCSKEEWRKLRANNKLFYCSSFSPSSTGLFGRKLKPNDQRNSLDLKPCAIILLPVQETIEEKGAALVSQH